MSGCSLLWASLALFVGIVTVWGRTVYLVVVCGQSGPSQYTCSPPALYNNTRNTGETLSLITTLLLFLLSYLGIISPSPGYQSEDWQWVGSAGTKECHQQTCLDINQSTCRNALIIIETPLIDIIIPNTQFRVSPLSWWGETMELGQVWLGARRLVTWQGRLVRVLWCSECLQDVVSSTKRKLHNNTLVRHSSLTHHDPPGPVRREITEYVFNLEGANPPDPVLF